MSGGSGLTSRDTEYLERARKLAHGGWGQVHPNPMVGCVLVRDDRVVAEGFHEVFGGPHAEIVALERAMGQAEGATAYVSLEPCDHHGKTPPCSQALVEAGVRRVVFGAADPGGSSGGGGQTLRAAGIEVVGPVWSLAEARAENPAFFHVAHHESPFVALKLAMSLDARIAGALGARTRITGVDAQREVHRLRSGFDAVMVGEGTALVDDPRLTPRLVVPGRDPTRRIVLSPDASLSPDAALFHDLSSAPLHVFCRLDASEVAMERLERAGAKIHPVSSAGNPSILDLGEVMAVAWELGIRAILCEGGAALAANLLRGDVAHRLYLFVAPMTLGGRGVPAFPDDADTLDWSGFTLAGKPAAFGSDTLIVLDRQEG